MENRKLYRPVQRELDEGRRMEGENRRHCEDLALINSLNSSINRGDSLQEVIRLLSGQIKRIYSVDGATLYLFSENKEHLVLQNLRLPSSTVNRIGKLIGMKIPKIKIPLTADSLYTEVLLSGKPKIISDPASIERLMADFTETTPSADYIRNLNFNGNSIESLPHPFYVIDAKDCTIKLANSATYAGSLQKDITCYALTHRSDKPCESPEHPCPLETVKKTGQPVVVEHIHYDNEGNSRNVEVYAYPVFYPAGNVARVIEYTLDITERKRLEDRLKREKERAEAADKLKSFFLANMSHEIRTPLNSIIGFTDLVLSGDDLSEEYRDYLQNSKESGNLLLALINGILDLSKIEAGQLHIEEIPCSLEGVLNAVGSNGRVLIAGKGKPISLRWSIAPNLSRYIVTDHFRLEQIMNNLVGNAIKFTDKGFIEFGVSLKDEQTLEFYVRDTGIGILEDKQMTIFEAFQQTDVSTTRKYGGTGLGLTIAKKLVELLEEKFMSVQRGKEVQIGSNNFAEERI